MQEKRKEKKDNNLERLVRTVKIFSDDIGIKFGQEKCVEFTFRKCSRLKSKNIPLENNN